MLLENFNSSSKRIIFCFQLWVVSVCVFNLSRGFPIQNASPSYLFTKHISQSRVVLSMNLEKGLRSMVDRRQFIEGNKRAFFISSATFLAQTQASNAAVLKSGAEAALEPGVTQEQISKVASKIPGYGPSDCYFPPFFQGSWQVERELVGVNTPLGEDKVEQPSKFVEANAYMNKKLSYKVRFINCKGNIVADRAFNAKTYGEAATPGKLASTGWEPENPNILAVTYQNGVVKEVKVTKRSFESPSPETFGTSEYARIAEASMEGPLGSVPELSAIRTLTRYKRLDETTVEALELIKYYPAVSMTSNPDPYLVLKSRLKFAKL
mmetsp:Transcript_34171/g.43631  ORF Transcript_34171/g.43631 Transcript_34171/m.43631 type:complete len:323 (+) Transcript_34171:90-1058(+)